MEPRVKAETLWPTPILQVEFPDVDDFNARLAQIIKSKEAEIRRGVPTPVAGLTEGVTTHWQEYNVLNFDAPECRILQDMVVGALHQYIQTYFDPDDEGFKILGISCWMNILRYGESLHLHHHDPAFLLGHYTVQTGYEAEPPPSSEEGHTVYFRPGFVDRSHEGLWDSDWTRSTRPVEGRLTVFPGYVRHEVRPYLGRTERISLALDCYVKKQNPIMHFGGRRWFVPSES